MFDAGQLLELARPEYYAVHHLSVLCYMLQHNEYSARGRLEARALLAGFVYEGWTPAMARRQNRISADSRNRNWSFTRGTKLPAVAEIDWRCTVADIRLDTAEHYCADVNHWANTILEDSEHLRRG